MVKLYPRVFSPFIQDKHNQTVIGNGLLNRRRSDRFIRNHGIAFPLETWEIQLLEALTPRQSPEAATIRAIMHYAKQTDKPQLPEKA